MIDEYRCGKNVEGYPDTMNVGVDCWVHDMWRGSVTR